MWVTGPVVLAFLLLAYLGSVRAAGRAAKALRLDHPGRPFEALDTSPNAIDLAMYTTSSSPRSIQVALGLVLPLATSLALLAVFYLTLNVGVSREADGWALAGGLLFLLALCLVVEIWGRRVRKAHRNSS